MRAISVIAVSCVALATQVAIATQYSATQVLETTLSVSLTHNGASETWKVIAKLSPDAQSLESIVVESPRERIVFPKSLIADLDRPDLTTLYLSTIDPAVYLHVSYGIQGPKYLDPPCPLEDTRYAAEYKIGDGKVIERYFRSPELGILFDQDPGVVPTHPPPAR